MTQTRVAVVGSPRPRIRPPSACARCNQDKLQYDISEVRLPCTRCRQNDRNRCAHIPPRRRSHARRKRASTFDGSQSVAASGTRTPDSELCESLRPKLRSLIPTLPFAHDVNEYMISPEPTHSPTRSEAGRTPSLQEDSLDSSTLLSSSCSPNTPRRSSTISLNRSFLEHQETQRENSFEISEVVSAGRLSPLNSAQEKPKRMKRSFLSQTSFRTADLTWNSSQNDENQQEIDTPHLSSIDIDYLRSKGAFEFPRPEVLDKIMEAFLIYFCPLYAIFDLQKLENSYRQQRLQPILLHAICLIGVTYCDQDVIEHAGYSSRRCARRNFYDKAKLLFDLGYETDAIVLLQTTIMLSFWGPQLSGHSSPYTCICSAINIAGSLGIQHESNYAQMLDHRHRGLLRRLWWTVVRRDAYFAALLGRPSLIELSQCDTQMLTLDDFDSVSTIQIGIESAVFQIECAKLSLILRHIIQQDDTQRDTTSVQRVHGMLERWQTELHVAVNWRKQTGTPEIFSSSLKLMFYHHLILAHLGRRTAIDCGEFLSDQIPGVIPSKAVVSAAQMISSTAFSLMMHSMAGKMAQEVFPAFLVSGIVLLQHVKQRHELIASLRKSALDNCLLILNEVHDRWDGSRYALEILGRLQSKTQEMVTDGINDHISNAKSRSNEFPTVDFSDSRPLVKWALSQTVTNSGQTDSATTSASSIVSDLMSTILPPSPCPKFDDSFTTAFNDFVSAAEDILWPESEIVIFQ